MKFQFAPPRGGRPGNVKAASPVANFNSRPREGGDQAHPGARQDQQISIRAPARGATALVCWHPARGYFNSRPREGGDAQHGPHRPGRGISIRAPARGATTASTAFSSLVEFQFAPPRGGRRGGKLDEERYKKDFNSRPREGGDQQLPTGEHLRGISIRAPARGATSNATLNGINGIISIRAPARGATAAPAPSRPTPNFNSRPREGGDLLDLIYRIK